MQGANGTLPKKCSLSPSLPRIPSQVVLVKISVGEAGNAHLTIGSECDFSFQASAPSAFRLVWNNKLPNFM